VTPQLSSKPSTKDKSREEKLELSLRVTSKTGLSRHVYPLNGMHEIKYDPSQIGVCNDEKHTQFQARKENTRAPCPG
jgi:hypothetical protein